MILNFKTENVEFDTDNQVMGLDEFDMETYDVGECDVEWDVEIDYRGWGIKDITLSVKKIRISGLMILLDEDGDVRNEEDFEKFFDLSTFDDDKISLEREADDDSVFNAGSVSISRVEIYTIPNEDKPYINIYF